MVGMARNPMRLVPRLMVMVALYGSPAVPGPVEIYTFPLGVLICMLWVPLTSIMPCMRDRGDGMNMLLTKLINQPPTHTMTVSSHSC